MLSNCVSNHTQGGAVGVGGGGGRGSLRTGDLLMGRCEGLFEGLFEV